MHGKVRSIFVHVQLVEETGDLALMLYGTPRHWADDIPAFVIAYCSGLSKRYEMWSGAPIGSVLKVAISENDISDCALHDNDLEEQHIIRFEIFDAGNADPRTICLASQLPEFGFELVRSFFA